MTQEGPLLDSLIRRLAECPSEFLGEPFLGTTGAVHTKAVISDLFLDLGGNLVEARRLPALPMRGKHVRNQLRLILVASWLFHDEWFRREGRFARGVADWLPNGFDELSSLVAAELFVTDPDRREEMVRLCMSAVGLRPRGETPAQASDRLKSLSSVERERIIRETKEHQERVRKLREAMQAKAAQEAAAKVCGE